MSDKKTEFEHRIKELEEQVESLLKIYKSSIGHFSPVFKETKATQKTLHLAKDTYLGVTELCQVCKVQPQTVYNWVSQDKIAYTKINGRLLFHKDDVYRLLREREYTRSPKDKEL